jgi:hypothetical protein
MTNEEAMRICTDMGVHEGGMENWVMDNAWVKFANIVEARMRLRCIELVLAGTAMPVQTRTLEALQRDRKRIAALIEEDGKP